MKGNAENQDTEEKAVAEKPSEEVGASKSEERPALPLLALAALGVVFGDLATSPLYALKAAFGEQAIQPKPENVLGLLSLVTWALLLVVCGKYACFVMRADNNGEGGMMALLALARAAAGRKKRLLKIVTVAGLLGAALFFGDSIITPAISVISAVEGLQLAAPSLQRYVLPIAILILLALFVLQRRGSAIVGKFFGPVMALWLLAIALLGLHAVVASPHVLFALNPQYAIAYLLHDGFRGFASLGAVVLVLTGSEALYADIGHFGTGPIRIAWFGWAMPALLLNYFGQGALLLQNPKAAHDPFYLLVPHALLYPMIVLAACATVIASQAVISGTFSMVRQGIHLGYLPRARVLHTSGFIEGQVYMPTVNYLLLLAVLGVALGFRSSQNLSGAYGIAVSGTMWLTTFLFMVVAHRNLHWGALRLLAFGVVYVIVDGALFSANTLKVVSGGWFPLAVAALAMGIMSTWHRGAELLRAHVHAQGEKLEDFVAKVRAQPPPQRVRGTAVFFTGDARWVPQALLQNVAHNQVLHERNLILKVESAESPTLPADECCEWEHLGEGFFRIELRFGFAEQPDVPARLAALRLDPVIDTDRLIYFLGRDEIVADKAKRRMMRWRRKLFALMARNATPATTYFKVPPQRLIEIGTRVEL